MASGPLKQRVASLAALEEPTRQALYIYVVDQPGDVSRDQAAKALGISRNLAGFHLDRLADAGLLDVSYRRLSGRSGPGAGRPSKLYRRSPRQIDVSLPQRSYELAAGILATALDTDYTPAPGDTLETTARGVGARIGAEAKALAGPRPSNQRLLKATLAALGAHGYEPVQEQGELRLRNCPFHALVADHKALVCGMNLALIDGVVKGLGVAGARPVLDPQSGYCCVRLKLAPPAAS